MLNAGDPTRVGRDLVRTVADPTRVGRDLVRTVADLTRVGRDLVRTVADLTGVGRDLVLTVADPTRVARGPVPTVADPTRVARGPVPTVADPTRVAQGLAPTVDDLTPVAMSRVLADQTHGRVVVGLAVIMPLAALSAVDLTFIAMAPMPHAGSRIFIATISTSLHLISRISTRGASNLTRTQGVSTPTPTRTRTDLTHIPSLTTLTAMRPLLISRIRTPITTMRTLTTRTLTPATSTLTPATTRPTLTKMGPTLITPFPQLVRRTRELVGLLPPLGAAAREALMAKASASKRSCRARVSRRVARRRIGFVPAASPSTANPPYSARACRTPIKYAWMAA